MTTRLTPEEWDVQYGRQAGWTRPTRTYLYRQANLARARRVLDVGSGTGAVTEELATRTDGQVIGIDVDPEMVAFARGGRGAPTTGWGTRTRFPSAEVCSTSACATLCCCGATMRARWCARCCV